MRTSLLLIGFFMWAGIASAQSSGEWMLEKEFPGNWISLAVDNLSNLYLVNADNQLKKLDAKGDSVAVYNDQRRYGDLGILDVSNPMLLLLHYPDYNTVVWLDRFFKPMHSLDLRTVGILSAKAVASSFDGKVWVYDDWEHRLKKFGTKGDLLLQTPDLRQVFGETINPIAIKEGQRQVYCYDSLRGVYVFDYFGNFEKKIPLIGWNNWTVLGSGFAGIKENVLMHYDIATGSLHSFTIPSAVFAGSLVLISNGKLYCLRKTTQRQPGALQIFSHVLQNLPK